ncbi:MAG: hypothetical protein ABR981_01140 [Candidatus Micrarchaeaceae archaeon]|jgi:hypothetical protein
MIIMENRFKGFKIRSISFAEIPEDQKGCDRLVYSLCKKEDSEIKPNGFEAYEIWHTSVDLDKPYSNDYKLDGFGFDGTTRANIHRAVTAGITYRINEDWDNYITLQNKFLKLKKLYPKPYTKESLQQYKGFLITTYHENIMLEGGYFVIEDDILWTQSICSYRVIDPQYGKLCSHASRFLYYNAMKYGKEQHCRKLYFGIGKDMDNPTTVAKFKLGFGGTPFKKNIYVKDYNPLLKVAGKFGIGNF